jgi:signal transduction histidine kinase
MLESDYSVARKKNKIRLQNQHEDNQQQETAKNTQELINYPVKAEGSQERRLNYLVDSQGSELQEKEARCNELASSLARTQQQLEILTQEFVGTERQQDFTEEQLNLIHAIANQGSIYVQQLQVLLEAKKNKLENERIREALIRERELNQLKNRIVRTISHEYRTPLTIISLATNLLESQNGKLSQEQKQQCFHQIRTATQHMTNLVEDALIVNQAESGELEFNPAYIDLIRLCRKIVANFQLTISNKHEILFIHHNCPEQVYLDQTLLQQILSNLLSNAIKYSPEGGLIELQLTSRKNKIILEIQDQGIGIPPEEQISLFQCFHRATNVGTLPGTGLGLAIVKKCVDIHGGEISFQSIINVGTKVIVKFPLDKAN